MLHYNLMLFTTALLSFTNAFRLYNPYSVYKWLHGAESSFRN